MTWCLGENSTYLILINGKGRKNALDLTEQASCVGCYTRFKNLVNDQYLDIPKDYKLPMEAHGTLILKLEK